MTPFETTLRLLPGLVLFPVLLGAGIFLWLVIKGLFLNKPKVPSPLATTRDGKWQQDLDFIVQNLPARHIQAFYVTSEAEWRTSAEALRNRISVLNDDEITFELMRLVGQLRDGHTGLLPQGVGELRYRFPVDVAALDDGLFIVRGAHEAQDSIGAQVLGVNGILLDEVIQRLDDTLFYDHENPSGLLKKTEEIFRVPLRLYLGGIIPSKTEATLMLRLRDGTETTLTITAREKIENREFKSADVIAPLYWSYKLTEARAQYQMLPEHKVMYFQYNDCEMNFFEFMTIGTEAMRTALKTGAEKFIVDLRFNAGGNELLFMLLNYRLRRTPLKLYGIMSRYTFSSGFDAITALKRWNRGVIVGQPASTRPNFFGNVTAVKLPHSGYVLFYPTTHSRKFPELGAAKVFEPDIPVSFTSHDYLAGRDPYLESILQL